MKYRSLILALSAIFMAGCHSLETSNKITDEVPFIASSESFQPQTKTSMTQDRQVVWSQGDRLAIFQGATIADEYLVTDESAGKTNATFNIVNDNSDINGSFSAGTEVSCNVALYPYAESLSLVASALEDEGTTFGITGYILPSTQDYAAESFANGAFPMVAVTQNMSDHTLRFKNVLGAIKLQLKGDQTVTSIKITGKNNEKLSGAATITAYSNNLIPAITMTGADAAAESVTLDCGAGVTLEEDAATEFIIALPPVVFSQGFTVTVTDSESKTYEINANTPNTILRSSILVMPAVTLGQTPGEDEDDYVTYVEYLFLDRTSLTMYPSTSITLVAAPDPVDVTDPTLTWSSSNPSVAQVDQNGKVTAVADGTARITVMAVGGVSATCLVTVKSATAVANNKYIVGEADYGYGIVIGDVVWAPVNCGYEPANGEYKGYPYGKLYQWGRKYGQGYDSNDASYPSGANLVQGPVAPSWGSSADHADEFFYGAENWCTNRINDLWADSNGKTGKDPCPKGWRVPTRDELKSLSANYSSWTKDSSEHNGYYFTGEYTYMEGIAQIFLPAAGARSRYGGVGDRGGYGHYWSSTLDYSGANRLFFFSGSSGSVHTGYNYQAYGCTVRCVQE